MSMILRKIGPCKCVGICTGNCSSLKSDEPLPTISEQKSFLLDRIYCINLPDSKDRKKAVTKMFDALENTSIPISFVHAVSPLDRDFHSVINQDNKVDTGFNPRCYCIKQKQPCMKHGSRRLREVEIAISLSHLKVYQKILKNSDDLILVCEDDIILLPNVLKILSHVLATLKDDLRSDKPIIIFGGGSRNNPGLKIYDPDKFHLKVSKSGIYSNYCYLINRAATLVLKKNAYPIMRPDDSYKRYLIGKEKISAYQIVPSICAELSSGINAKPIYHRLSKETSLENLKEIIKIEGKKRVKIEILKEEDRQNNQ